MSGGAKKVVKVDQERQPYRTELTPVSFLRRSAYVFPDRTAIIHGARRYTYRQFEERANRLASHLRQLGLRHLDRVAFIAPNTPAMLEAHFGVPAAGLVLVPINTRLNADEIGYILKHSGAKVLFIDREFEPLIQASAHEGLRVIRIDDTGAGPGLHRRRWSVRYRGGVERAVGAVQLVGPFQDPRAPGCVERWIL